MNKQENENKRKRGRPRKKPLLDENVSTTSKKRGRPPKKECEWWFDKQGNSHCITPFGDKIILPF